MQRSRLAQDSAALQHLATLVRYKWAIVATTLTVPIVAVAVSLRQPDVYSATVQVLLSRQDIGPTVTGIPTQSVANDEPERFVRTQALVARSSGVRRLASQRARVAGVSAAVLEEISSINEDSSSDLLGFSVEFGTPGGAEKIARSYADAFVEHKLQMETEILIRARADIQGRIDELARNGAAGTQVHSELVRNSENLRTLQLLLAPATVIGFIEAPAKVAPTPFRNGVMGTVVGLLLGIGVAFGLKTVDSRVRTSSQLEEELQVRVLAKLPSSPRDGQMTILGRPSDALTEAFSRLRVAFEIANREHDARVVMVTSASANEGKSTTTANLGVALAKSGRHAVLVDLDLRRPSLNRLLQLKPGPGVTDVVLGRASLQSAMRPVRLGLQTVGDPRPAQGVAQPAGRLSVLGPGMSHVDPASFVESEGFLQLLAQLRSSADIVLVDTPPLLATGEALALTSKVDGVIVLSRLGTATHASLHELSNIVDRSVAPVLGLVITGAELDERHGFASYLPDYYSHDAPAARPDRPTGPHLPAPSAPRRAAEGGTAPDQRGGAR